MRLTREAALDRFVARLLLHSSLSGEEQDAIRALSGRVERAIANRDLVHPTRTVEHAILVGEGVLGRFDAMLDGSRQITAFFIAGDMCDLYSVVVPTAGWGVCSLSASTYVEVPHAELRALAVRYPNLGLAFWRDTTVDASILAKWIANVGRKEARARIAHLLCEMGVLSERAGLGMRTSYPLRVTQEHIGDAMGLTSVHVNRSLQFLRAAGLLSMKQGRVEILNWDAMIEVADFAPAFLMPGDQRRLAA